MSATEHPAAAIGVRVDRVSKRFAHRVKGEVYAAREVSLDVRPGEPACIDFAQE